MLFFDKRWALIKSQFLVVLFISVHSHVFAETSQAANPFLIDFPIKEELTHEDYLSVQNKLRQINIAPLLKELYGENSDLIPLEEFNRRCTRGITQTLIDAEKQHFPVKKLEKIGNGGDLCIVNCCPYNGDYPNLIQAIPKTLQDIGFNGYFYYRIGGFPNPTGKEIRYAGVPYCFKIFMMLEAQKLGFNKVLWIDTSMLPIKDPTPLFAIIEEKGTVLSTCYFPEHSRIFPKTQALLKDLTGIDMYSGNVRHFATQLFGLKMDAPKTKKLIDDYYRFVEMGTPFLSSFPEEFVFASLMEREGGEWPSNFIFTYLRYEGDTTLETAKNEGCYFYLRKH